ncbi:hypothetical protein C8Q80DRAFT_755885 [Daedaleopsis nitida]|nr:hypothetical protein C8Q80DRAFT_755885 [Daedaleopsis nitida]
MPAGRPVTRWSRTTRSHLAFTHPPTSFDLLRPVLSRNDFVLLLMIRARKKRVYSVQV